LARILADDAVKARKRETATAIVASEKVFLDISNLRPLMKFERRAPQLHFLAKQLFNHLSISHLHQDLKHVLNVKKATVYSQYRDNQLQQNHKEANQTSSHALSSPLRPKRQISR
jgi:hypothetical protein